MPAEKDGERESHLGAPDLRELVELHIKASNDLKQHQEEYRTGLAADEKAAAQNSLKRVRKLQTIIRALSAQLK